MTKEEQMQLMQEEEAIRRKQAEDAARLQQEQDAARAYQQKLAASGYMSPKPMVLDSGIAEHHQVYRLPERDWQSSAVGDEMHYADTAKNFYYGDHVTDEEIADKASKKAKKK